MSQRLADDVSAGPFRIVCHGAGIDDEQVSRLTEFDHAVAIAPQASFEHRRLCLVQSAAECMERGAFHDRWAIIGRSLRWEQGSPASSFLCALSLLEGLGSPW